MNTYFFKFDPIGEEIARKLKSMSCPTDRLYVSLMDKVKGDGLSTNSMTRIDNLFTALTEQNLKKYNNLPLNHPIRVAALWWDVSGCHEYETVALGLCHNLREAGDNALQAIEEEFLCPESRVAIAAQTIDRAQERNLDYLGRFYDDLNGSGDTLILKGCDKLDNFLSYGLYDLAPYYFMVLDDFVIPRLSKRQPKLAVYLQQVADYVREDEAKALCRKGAPL